MRRGLAEERAPGPSRRTATLLKVGPNGAAGGGNEPHGHGGAYGLTPGATGTVWGAGGIHHDGSRAHRQHGVLWARSKLAVLLGRIKRALKVGCGEGVNPPPQRGPGTGPSLLPGF